MKNYAIVEISTKKKIISNTGSISMRIRANEAYRFTDFRILRHNDVITIDIGHMSSDSRSGYRTLFVC